MTPRTVEFRLFLLLLFTWFYWIFTAFIWSKVIGILPHILQMNKPKSNKSGIELSGRLWVQAVCPHKLATMEGYRDAHYHIHCPYQQQSNRYGWTWPLEQVYQYLLVCFPCSDIFSGSSYLLLHPLDTLLLPYSFLFHFLLLPSVSDLWSLEWKLAVFHL